MTNQHLRDSQIGFLQRCSECFLIVQDFLHDRVRRDIVNGVLTSDTHKTTNLIQS